MSRGKKKRRASMLRKRRVRWLRVMSRMEESPTLVTAIAQYAYSKTQAFLVKP